MPPTRETEDEPITPVHDSADVHYSFFKYYRAILSCRPDPCLGRVSPEAPDAFETVEQIFEFP
jgi:hypothetical protein